MKKFRLTRMPLFLLDPQRLLRIAYNLVNAQSPHEI